MVAISEQEVDGREQKESKKVAERTKEQRG
jgi:hypothetical protein